MPGRTYSSPTYRYGFNGKENDDEAKGITGSQQNYGFRVYDSRLGKFLSVDPLAMDFCMLTPYQFSANTPIQAIDLDGLEPSYTNKNAPGMYRFFPSLPSDHLTHIPPASADFGTPMPHIEDHRELIKVKNLTNPVMNISTSDISKYPWRWSGQAYAYAYSIPTEEYIAQINNRKYVSQKDVDESEEALTSLSTDLLFLSAGKIFSPFFKNFFSSFSAKNVFTTTGRFSVLQGAGEVEVSTAAKALSGSFQANGEMVFFSADIATEGTTLKLSNIGIGPGMMTETLKNKIGSGKIQELLRDFINYAKNDGFKTVELSYERIDNPGKIITKSIDTGN